MICSRHRRSTTSSRLRQLRIQPCHLRRHERLFFGVAGEGGFGSVNLKLNVRPVDKVGSRGMIHIASTFAGIASPAVRHLAFKVMAAARTTESPDVMKGHSRNEPVIGVVARFLAIPTAIGTDVQ